MFTNVDNNTTHINRMNYLNVLNSNWNVRLKFISDLKEGRKDIFIYRRIQHILFTFIWRRTYGFKNHSDSHIENPQISRNEM